MSDAAVAALIAGITSVVGVLGAIANTFLSTKRDVRIAKLEVRSEVCEKENVRLHAEIARIDLSNVKDRTELEAQIQAVDVKTNGNGLPPPM